MSTLEIRRELAELKSGECRWVGDESIHVYCRAPMVEAITAWGTLGWERGPATYMVATCDTESPWSTIGDAAEIVRGHMGRA